MNALKFFAAMVVSLFTVSMSAEETVQRSTEGQVTAAAGAVKVVKKYTQGRFTVEEAADHSKVIYGDGAYPPARPAGEFGIYRHQLIVNYSKKQLWYYVCGDYAQAVACVPKFGDVVKTPDPSSLPQAVVEGLIRRVWDIKFFEHGKKLVRSGIVWWTDDVSLRDRLFRFEMRQDTVEQLLDLMSSETKIGVIQGGFQVILIRGDTSGVRQVLND